MQLSDGVWPDRLPAVEVRIARPTDKLAEVLGYPVAMVGLPGDKYHLEFTSHGDGSPGRAPSGESGHEPVELDNPWWRENGAIAFADPDNWRIVLMPNPIPLVA